MRPPVESIAPKAPVADVMSEDLVTIDPGSAIEAAVERLRTHDVRKLPVIDGQAVVISDPHPEGV